MKKILVIMVLFAAFTTGLTAQVLKPVKWQITQKKVSDGVYDIICKATVDGGWHLYDTKLPEGAGKTGLNIRVRSVYDGERYMTIDFAE